MAADYHFLIHGLVVASDVDLPAPRIPARQADITYRITLGVTPSTPSHSRSDDADDPWAIEHWIGTQLAVEFPGRATFELSRSQVTLLSDESNDPDLVLHLFLDHVLPRVVALRGDFMLHAAGAVSSRGGAHLFLGKAGTGKSTIVTGLLADGWLLLDDDGIRVTDSGDEGLYAFPGSADVRLLPDVAERLVPGLKPGRPIASGSVKRRFAVDGACLRAAAGPAPVAGVYVLSRAETAEPSLERFGFADALGTIAQHAFHLADEPAAIAREAFERAAALAAATPVWRLVLPDRLRELDAVQALIADVNGT